MTWVTPIPVGRGSVARAVAKFTIAIVQYLINFLILGSCHYLLLVFQFFTPVTSTITALTSRVSELLLVDGTASL